MLPAICVNDLMLLLPMILPSHVSHRNRFAAPAPMTPMRRTFPYTYYLSLSCLEKVKGIGVIAGSPPKHLWCAGFLRPYAFPFACLDGEA